MVFKYIHLGNLESHTPLKDHGKMKNIIPLHQLHGEGRMENPIALQVHGGEMGNTIPPEDRGEMEDTTPPEDHG